MMKLLPVIHRCGEGLFMKDEKLVVLDALTQQLPRGIFSGARRPHPVVSADP